MDIHIDNDGALFWASFYGHIEVVRFIIDKEPTIDVNEALIATSECGHIDIVKLLLDKGNDIHKHNLALFWASRFGHLEIVKFLLEKGGDPLYLTSKMKLELGYKILYWEIKPDDLPPFRKLTECPISNVKLTDDVSKLGCSKCLNVFAQMALEEWFKKGCSDICPVCRTGKVFYLA